MSFTHSNDDPLTYKLHVFLVFVRCFLVWFCVVVFLGRNDQSWLIWSHFGQELKMVWCRRDKLEK